MVDLFAFLLLLCYSAPLFAADAFDACKKLWSNASTPADYQRVLIRMQQIGNQIPATKRTEADYIMGTSNCRTGFPGVGVDILNEVLRASLSTQARAAVQNEITLCQGVANAVARPQVVSWTTGPSIHGNGGHWDTDFTADPHVRNVTDKELASRLYPLAKAPAALAAFQARVGNLRTISLGRFVIAGDDMNERELNALGNRLEQFVQFYATRYHMTIPDKVISIYAPASVASVINWAAQQHGILLPPDVWDYSSYQDMSIAASVANEFDIGPITHELLHLMIRGNFDDCPVWLEEGLAQTYTTVMIGTTDPTLLRGDNQLYLFSRTLTGIIPVTNAKTKFLRQQGKARPSIPDLMAADWTLFNVSGTDLRSVEGKRVDTMQSMARSFVMYLDDRNVLQSVYFEVRDGHIGAGGKSYTSDAKIVEAALKMPMADIETDFNTWLTNKR